MNRLLFCEPWPVSNFKISLDQFLDGIISRFFTPHTVKRDVAALRGSLCRRRSGLFSLRPRTDRRRLAVGEDLGDAKHRDLVAIATLAARILAAPLLERDHLGAALVLQHFGCNGSARDRRCAEHRRISAEQENFAKLHDRADIAVDLANLEHIIRNDAVLPAAGFDDCEHRFIPSCSIPASDVSHKGFARVGFLVSRYGYDFRADRGRTPQNRAKTSGARNPAPDAGTYSR